MAGAWQQVLGYAPSALVELTLAHVLLENDSGRGLWNNNPGNLTTTEGNRYYILDNLNVNDIGQRISQDDPDRVILRFWDFATPEAGFLAYCEWIAKRPEFLAAGKAGDALAFAKQIKKTGYTPYIDPQAVAKSLDAMVRQIRPVLPATVLSLGPYVAMGIGLTLAAIFWGKV